MTKSIKILGIAPYEELNHSMRIIGERYNHVEANIYTADLVEGQKLATQLYQDDYDAILSRGGTAKLIRKTVSIPVIDVSLSIYDILSSIRLAKNYTQNFAIVAYPSITEKAHLLCDLLGYHIEIHTIDEHSDAGTILDILADKNYELILCDAITNHLALSKSMNTILITSGSESVKNAYDDALSIVKYVNKVKFKNDILENAIQSQNEQLLIFDELYQLVFSNLDANLAEDILKNLQTKTALKNNHQYYSTTLNQFFTLKIKAYFIDQQKHYSCLVQESSSPVLTNKHHVSYQRQSEIAESTVSKLLFTQFIPQNIKQDLQKNEGYYSSYLVFGESGTAKKNIAYQIYLDQTKYHNYLITINCKLTTDKLWKFLVNPNSGPFVEVHNTIFFSNIEHLKTSEIEHLISLIKATNVLKHNSLIFTYDINKSEDQEKLLTLKSQLDNDEIYAPALRERKNELSIITTLILNKMNIECNKDVMGFEPKAFETFLNFNWPGNLNQLQYCVKELVINASTHYISEHQVVELLNKERLIQNFSNTNVMNFEPKNSLHQPTLFDYTKEIILNVLEQNNGNQTKTATQLGISRTTLWRYLKDEG